MNKQLKFEDYNFVVIPVGKYKGYKKEQKEFVEKIKKSVQASTVKQ